MQTAVWQNRLVEVVEPARGMWRTYACVRFVECLPGIADIGCVPVCELLPATPLAAELLGVRR